MKSAVRLAQVLQAVPQLWAHLPILARRSIAAVNTELREYCRLTDKDAVYELSKADMKRHVVIPAAIPLGATSLQIDQHFSNSVLTANLVFPPMPNLHIATFGSMLISSSSLASITAAKWPQLRGLQLNVPGIDVTTLQLLFKADWPLLEVLILLDPARTYKPYKSKGSYPAELSHSASLGR